MADAAAWEGGRWKGRIGCVDRCIQEMKCDRNDLGMRFGGRSGAWYHTKIS